jgi:hypothetical protein
MIWTIVLLGGLYTTSVTYIGQFTEEAACNKAVAELKNASVKIACIQIQPAQQAPTPPKK